MNPESVAPIVDMTPETRSGGAETRSASDSSVFGFVIMAIMGLLVMWQFDAPKAVLKDHWMAIAAVLSLAAISTLLFLPTKFIGGQTRVGIVIFGLSPLVAALVAGVVLLPDPYQVPVLRGVFLLVVVLLPPTMFYLFIATRKYSLLNEFVSNVSRLGLLDRATAANEESEDVRRLRITSYLQKFEATYGSLPPDLMDAIRASDDIPGVLARPTAGRAISAGVSDVFTPETTAPLALSTMLIALGWLNILPLFLQPQPADWTLTFAVVSKPVHYAFLGAYFFSIQMLFRRYVLRDLRPSAYMAVTMRIVLAVVGTWVIANVWALFGNLGFMTVADANRSGGLDAVAFTIGVFPAIAWAYVQGLTKKLLNAGAVVPSLKTQLPISDLDGLTVWHETRLEEEDIENVPNMATANFVDLMLNTRVPADRIIDWVDQAILYTHLGADEAAAKRREALRKCGIRTASAYVKIAEDSRTRDELKNATNEQVELVCKALETNPNLRLVQRWRMIEQKTAMPMPSL
jgi:hypothetical protein